MKYKDYFKNKKVTVMGIDPIGRGVQDAEFIAKLGARVVATDFKKEEEIKESVEKLKKYPNIKFVLGGHEIEDFENTDLVIRAASVPLDSKYLKTAREKGVEIETDETLFVKLAPKIKLIGVTGTRGKSTVTQMIYESLIGTGKIAHLGGNVRGVATLPLLEKVKEGDFIVMELDSWKLQGFGAAGISPHIAVFTNLMEDHQNYYHSMDLYFKDKAKIFTNQTKDDYLVLGSQIANKVQEEFEGVLKAKVVVVDGGDFPKSWNLKVPGKHNVYNAAIAAQALKFSGMSGLAIKEGLETFGGVEGRLQFVKNIKGISVYNDNNATTPDATISALEALGEDKNIVLLMGGSDKGIDMSKLPPKIATFCKGVVMLREDGTEAVRGQIEALEGLKTASADTLDDWVRLGLDMAQKGDILLFSPAFASFGRLFKNEYDRGDQFLEIIRGINNK